MDKSCTSVFLAGMFLFVPSDPFAVVCIVYSHKTERENESKKHERDFIETDNQACTGCVLFC